MGILIPILLVSLVFFPILYSVIRSAVEEGTLNALIKFEKTKNGEQYKNSGS